jgi:hypothetical protein
MGSDLSLNSRQGSDQHKRDGPSPYHLQKYMCQAARGGFLP